MNSTIIHSLQFAVNRVLFKIFGSMSNDEYIEVCNYFGLLSVDETISVRQNKFSAHYFNSINIVCECICNRQ